MVLHPGQVLFEDFMQPLGVSINELAREIFVPPNRISAIVNGKRGITADTALRLGQFFGMPPMMWLEMQSEYDLAQVEEGDWPVLRDRIVPRI